MTNYALFRGHLQISEAHSTKVAAYMEAYTLGLVQRWVEDFDTPEAGAVLVEGHEVREVGDEQ